MPITAKAASGTSHEPIPSGLNHGVCYGIIDVGTQPSGNPQFKDSRKVIFLFELPEERITIEGKDLPRGTSATFTLSLGDKSKLRPALESWRGRPFTPEELNGFDITKVLGANAYLNITHVVKGDKTYANITTINPLPKGIQKKTAENKLISWSIEDQKGPIVPPEGIPEWIKARIMASKEYIDSHMAQEPTQPSAHDAGSGHNQTDDSEDVPF